LRHAGSPVERGSGALGEVDGLVDLGLVDLGLLDGALARIDRRRVVAERTLDDIGA
jgi:hypothetical protein